ncbi:MAG: hypothetical protein WCV71_01895 [Patescibacteria group bacterium]
MKKSLFLSFLLVILLSGCGIQTNDNQALNPENVKSDNNMPDFVRPEEEPNMRGLVSNVIGNEVTILELNMPNREEIPDEQLIGNDNEESKQAPVAGFGGGAGMRPGMGGGTGNRANMDEESRLAMMKSMSTGEAKVTIPVGIKMLTNVNGEMTEATLLDIKTNQTLMIWLNKDIEDRNIAEFVIIN